jgi:hypothetical protein|tara:strand:- start:16 stop:381 length:366 start_codon:yes stop_codon:yes gene_type:complete
MLIKFPAKTRYLFNIVLPFVLLFQGTLPTIGKQIYIQTNFGELIYDKCKDPGHSHPPLSQRETSNDPEKFVNLDLNNSFFINNPPKFFNISGENKFKIFTPLPELLSAQFPPARGPPYFEV